MGETHVVRFEPVGIEIEVNENQTVLRAAAEQGITLMHGCKEGQCASCKSFVLEGDDIELDRYSTFALPDYELEEGFTLLCRAHVFEDVTIELLNYDEEMIRSGHPIQEAVAEVVSNEHVTHDMRHLVLKLIEPTEIAYWPGQYVDITLPGTDISRSFSMANVSSKESGQLEFIIRCYPDGKFSHFLDTELAVGDRLDVTGPFGVFTLRDGRDSDLVFVGGGAGMAPILAVLRSLAERGSTRKVTYYYGARNQRDLCFEKELYALTQTVPNFTFVPALSEADDSEPWDGEVGFITDIVRKYETDLSGADSYVCGPLPMVEAAMDVLSGLGAPEKNIYYDKFTTTGSS
jgi:propane monooxygenase reductase subunit